MEGLGTGAGASSPPPEHPRKAMGRKRNTTTKDFNIRFLFTIIPPKFSLFLFIG